MTKPTNGTVKLEGGVAARYEELCQEMLPSISLIKILRDRLSLSQADVAAVLGVSQPNVSKLEGRRDIRISTLSKIVRAQGGKVRIIVELADAEPIHLEV